METTHQSIWVLGGGHFGRHAVATLQQSRPAADITLVEKEPQTDPPANVHCVEDDGVAWLARHFTKDATVSRIIPAVPLHLAAEWLKAVLTEQGIAFQTVQLPDSLLRRLPHPLRQNDFQAVISHADFLCPADCREPDTICTATRKPRPQPLFQLIQDLEHAPFVPLVIRSRQFAPGVGGFFPEDLWDFFQKALFMRHTPLLIGTACKCHGIVDGMIID
ncbi:MAG: hypothetical protein ABR512_02080 [Desulfopila sp.]